MASEERGAVSTTIYEMSILFDLSSIFRFLTIQHWPFKDFSDFGNLKMIDGYHELHKPGAGSGPGTTALFVSAGVRHWSIFA